MKQRQTVIIYAFIVLMFCVTLGGTILIDSFQGDATVEQIQNQQSENIKISYDIYQDQEILATVYDYDALENYLIKTFTNKISYGNGKLYFGESMSVLSKYDDNIQKDDVSTYQKIAEQGEFTASVVEVKILSLDKSYYVSNMSIWNNAIHEISQVLANGNPNDTYSFGYEYEIQLQKVAISQIQSEQDLIADLMETDQSYFVTEGQTLMEVAQENQLTTNELLLANPNISENAIIVPGSELLLADIDYRHAFSKISILTREEPILYDIEYVDDDGLYTGQEEVLQEGIDGTQLVQFSVKYSNTGTEVVLNQQVIQILTDAQTKIVKRGTKEAPNIGTGKFIWPTSSRRTSTEFGGDYLFGSYRFHSGLDINQGLNAPVSAVDNGVVITNEFSSGYGNYIIVDHNNGYWSLYAHLNNSNVRVGQVVRQGEQIGAMGTTGLSTGVHLHLEIRVGGNTKANAQDPRKYLQG